jgi:TonB family protein
MFLPNLALKGTVVLGMAWIVAIVLRNRSAAWRHLIWTSAFGALLALPVLSAVLPALPVGVPAQLLAPGAVFRAAGVAPAERQQAGTASVLSALSAPPVSRTAGREWVFLLWGAGAALILTQISVNWLAMLVMRRKAEPFSGIDLSHYTRLLGLRRRVELLQGRSGSMPMAFGLFRAAIFLPADAMKWTVERRQVVVLHELAHVQRGDLLLHLVGRAALGFYWWNPLAWAAWRQFLKERERAADDLVLNAGARPSDYANHLLEIARSLQPDRALGTAALAMARRSQLEGRLLAILDAGANRQAPRRASVALAALLALGAVVPFAALRAQDRATASLPEDVDATIRAAVAQKNHDMLESAAKAAEVLQKYDLARRLLDSSLDIRAEQSGAQSVEYGMGLVKLGDLERSRGNQKEADAFYTKAVSVLGSRPEAAPALIRLGISTWSSTKDPEAAVEFFQKAQVGDPAHAGPALTWMALTQKQPAAAEDFFKQALALESPGSAEQALTMELYSSFLNRQNRSSEASSWQEQAGAARKTLGAHTLAVNRPSGIAGVRIGGGVTAPKLLSKVEPSYTEEARLAKYQGTVVVATDIGTDGTAQSMRVVRGLGLGLDEEALKAISQWKFQPAAKDGQPVAVQATIEVNFRLL